MRNITVRRLLSLFATSTLVLPLASRSEAQSRPAPAQVDSIKKTVVDSIERVTSNAARMMAAADSLRSCVTRRSPLPKRMTHCPSLVEVFADGNVKDVLGTKGSAAASGALGLHFVGNSFDVTGLINVAGNSDTVTKAYGNAILVPAAGGALKAAMLNIRGRARKWGDPACVQPEYPMICNLGFRVHLDASSRTWATATARVASGGDTVEQVTATREAPVWGAGVDLTYYFFRSAITGSDSVRRPAEMLIDVGFMRRALRGDLAAKTREDERRRLLGSGAVNFDGIEVGLAMIYDKVRASLTYVKLNGTVDGLSGGQIVAAVDIRAALASGLLR